MRLNKVLTKNIIMKKLLLYAFAIGGFLAFNSCAAEEECVCDNGVTLTEADAEDAGTSLSTACSFAEVGGASCTLE